MEYGNDFDFSYGVPDGSTMSSSGSDIFSVIMTVYLLVIVAAVMIGIVKYVFKSIALYRLAQRTGNANPWMAWVPFARSYLQGDLAGSMPLKKRRLQSPGLWKVLIPLIGTAVIAGLYFLFIVVAGIGTALIYSAGMGASAGIGDTDSAGVSDAAGDTGIVGGIGLPPKFGACGGRFGSIPGLYGFLLIINKQIASYIGINIPRTLWIIAILWDVSL